MKTHRIFIVLTLLIAVVNLAFPKNYLILFVNHLSYLPLDSGILWPLTIVVMMILLRRGAPKQWSPAVLGWSLALLAMASFVLYRTQFPGLHGDGEGGGFPQGAGIVTARCFPAAEGRLQAFLNVGLRDMGFGRLRFHYHFNDLFLQNYETNNAWILLTILAGIAIVLFVTVTGLRLRTGINGKIGLPLAFLTCPAMLGAYGHFDSYIVPAGTVILWFAACLAVMRRPGAWHAHLWVGVAAILALWAHPILGLLIGLSVALVVLPFVARKTRSLPSWKILLVGIAYGFLPFLAKFGNREYFAPALAGDRWWLIYEKFAALLQAGLPALVLVAIALIADRRLVRRLTASQAFAALTFVSGAVMVFTTWLGYGMKDEFIYSLFGVLMLAGAILLVLFSRVPRTALLQTALFSLFLFVPRMLVYSDERMNDRFVDHYPKDRCWANRELSPYWILAQMQPLDDASFHDRRLDILEAGFRSPTRVTRTEAEDQLNQALYAAWSLAFGRYEQADREILALLKTNPKLAVELWKEQDIFSTGRYNFRTPWIARERSLPILAQVAAADPASTVWPEFSRRLGDRMQTDPFPLPYKGVIQPDRYALLYKEGFAAGLRLKGQDQAQNTCRTLPELAMRLQEIRDNSELVELPRFSFYAWHAAFLDGYQGRPPCLPLEPSS